jgi:hypothetical protein
MTAQDLFQVIFWVAMYFMVLAITGYYFWEYGKRQAQRAKEYEKKYFCIERIIDNYSMNEINYDWIVTLLENLGSLPYKDKEKTSVLTTKFFIKYSEIRLKRLNEV